MAPFLWESLCYGFYSHCSLGACDCYLCLQNLSDMTFIVTARYSFVPGLSLFLSLLIGEFNLCFQIVPCQQLLFTKRDEPLVYKKMPTWHE